MTPASSAHTSPWSLLRLTLLLVLTTLLTGPVLAQVIDWNGFAVKFDSSLLIDEGRLQIGHPIQAVILGNDLGGAGYLDLSNANGSTYALFEEGFFVFFPGFAVTSNLGDGSLQLTVDAVNATEILNETGVTQNVHSTGQNLTGTQVVESTTITAPTPGFVLVIGSGVLDTDHTNGADSEALFGVSDDCDGTPTLSSDQDNQLEIPGAAPTGLWAFPVSAQKIFPVSAGANTFCIVTSEVSGSWETWDESLSAIFIPTAYGTIDQTRPGGDGNKGEGGMTASDIAAEQARAAAANQARIDRELAEMRARIAELERYLEQVKQEQGLGDTTGGGR